MFYVLTTTCPAEDRILVQASTDAGTLMTKAQFLHMDQIGAAMASEKPLTWGPSIDCPNAAWDAYDDNSTVEYRIEAVELR